VRAAFIAVENLSANLEEAVALKGILRGEHVFFQRHGGDERLHAGTQRVLLGQRAVQHGLVRIVQQRIQLFLPLFALARR